MGAAGRGGVDAPLDYSADYAGEGGEDEAEGDAGDAAEGDAEVSEEGIDDVGEEGDGDDYGERVEVVLEEVSVLFYSFIFI